MNPSEVKKILNKKDEIAIFADYFSLLDQIDKQLQKEDPEYKKLYYSNGNNENK